MATLSIPSLFGFGATRKSPLSIVWRDKADPEVYEEARVGRIFNSRRPERYPVAIVFAKRESDIVEAVNLAIKENCRVSIRSGGHSWPAWSLRDEAILLDLGNHFEMELDETTGVVRVAPATKGRDLVAFLATKGRVVSTGNCPSVGIGGFLLGGGQGWNCNVGFLNPMSLKRILD
jgi:FAD/FMN-containing dehydrogenase